MSNQNNCKRKTKGLLSRSGIGIPEAVVKESGLKVDDKIGIAFIPLVKCILLSKINEPSNVKENNDAFKLTYTNTRKKMGGKVHHTSFCKNYLQALVSLPKRNIPPVVLEKSEYRLALLLEPIEWIKRQFIKDGLKEVSKDAIGVYELLGGASDTVLRIGEGRIMDRIGEHLNDPLRFKPKVKNFRYVELDDKEDCQLMEKLLIDKFERENGVLPLFNEIRA